MEAQKFQEMIESAVKDADLVSTEIPSIDLYLEQILSLVADKNKEGSATADRTLTKNMINNYSKDGLITPVKGKKYSKEQIVQMLVVYSLKNTLSIDEIKRAMQAVYAKEDYSGQKLIEAYDHAMEIKQSQKHRCPEIVQEMLAAEGLDVQQGEDYFVALLTVASLSVYFRNIAKAMLEEYPQLESDEEKRQREKEEKRERKARKKAESTEAAAKEQE
ncbi:MAG: DUF1836 domain-containing protein [Ruminococcaceae bacterium]|nr:DUF1836 domain-containing protein [Oscillospiraceae bacterium]